MDVHPTKGIWGKVWKAPCPHGWVQMWELTWQQLPFLFRVPGSCHQDRKGGAVLELLLISSGFSISGTGFPYEKVVQRVLYLQVLDYDRFSRNDPIGEVSIPLNKVDLTQMQTFWKDLKPCSDGSVRPWTPSLPPGEGR